MLKITDFGLTKVFADFGAELGGDVGVVAGTPPYMAPEQCLGLPNLDTRADIYALGVILYELLTGQRPFVAESVIDYLQAHLSETPDPPRQLVPDLPEALDRLVMRCLARSPERRYPSFTALRAELEACYTALTGYAPILPRADDASDENVAALAGVELARAISLVTLGRYEEAMTFFDLAVEHDPTLGRAWYFRGLALNGLGRFDEALTCLDRVVRLDPRDPNAWVEKGRALTRAGRREEALGCFDNAIAINPWHAPALYEKGACLLFLGHFEAAAACIDEVATLQPGPAVEAARRACQAGRERQLAVPEPRPVIDQDDQDAESVDRRRVRLAAALRPRRRLAGPRAPIARRSANYAPDHVTAAADPASTPWPTLAAAPTRPVRRSVRRLQHADLIPRGDAQYRCRACLAPRCAGGSAGSGREHQRRPPGNRPAESGEGARSSRRPRRR